MKDSANSHLIFSANYLFVVEEKDAHEPLATSTINSVDQAAYSGIWKKDTQRVHRNIV